MLLSGYVWSGEESKFLEETKNEPEIPSLLQIDGIKDFIANQKPYLNSNMTINKLAMQTGISARELSFIINQGFGQNFFDFICDYRINYTKDLLKQPEKIRAILDVMYDSGFNSKSVFNTAFKQKTSMTPSQYRTTAQKGS
ncbi:AraC family transcriptional regulator [uncultured Tolumonas sp.]|uniref:helix-turn-helix domain-containing protein n=1 Tax=uncultured Tolumonas sp. TaxID=263765 RepID=UPI002931C6E5|nr:AraC family transcriptional regulator [uncultured Tolumonas sp.]